MKNIQLAICKGIEGVPTEIQIIPFGRHETSKGAFVLDDEGMAAVLADFEGRANDMVIDYEHQTMFGGEAPAAGWIKKLVNRGREGIWAVVEWTERAKGYLENREYRYLSPVFLRTVKDYRVVRLLNAALTNNPAIDGMVPVVNKRDVQTYKKEGKQMLEKLLKLLALKEGATEEQALEAVKGVATELAAMKEALGVKSDASVEEVKTAVMSLKEGGPQVVAHGDVLAALGLKEGASVSEVKGTIEAMKAGHEQTGDLAKEVAALKDDLARRDAEDLVAAAMKEGKVTPAQRDWALTYAKRDPEGFTVFVAKAPKVVPTGEHAGGGGPTGGGGGGIEETQLAVNKAMGIDEETFKKHNPATE